MEKNIPNLFNKQDLFKDFANKRQLGNWIFKQMKKNKIKKIRNNLYCIIDDTGFVIPNKFQIATKVAFDSFVAYHSALEYYGLANQVMNNMIICSSIRFRNFTFDDIDYVHKGNDNNIEVINNVYDGVRVSSLERTVIDCIDDINLAGGIDELLNALDQIKILDERKLLNILESYDKILLYQKVGYILEQFNDQLGLSNNFFEICRNKLTNQIKYFLQDSYKDIEYNSTWKLMAPKKLKSHINGGYE